MCVAIVTPKGQRIPTDKLLEGWQTNGHGGGFAYVKKGKVAIEKGFMTYPEFEKAYLAAARKFADKSPFLVHMRIRTSGLTDKENTHPFKIKGGAMIHNGVLFTPSKDDEKNYKDFSDTRIFAARMYNVLTKDDIIISKKKLESTISWNKMAFLYDDGDYVILNEGAGFWVDGIWYSNRSCEVSTYSRRAAVTPSAR